MKIAILNDTHTGVRGDMVAMSDYQGRFYKEIFFPYPYSANINSTSAFLAACDIKKWPIDPITPKLIAKNNWYIFGIIKSLGKKSNDVIKRAKE